MTTRSRPTVSDEEVVLMADVLRRRHGIGARGVALNLAFEHRAVGDETRASQWDRVGARLASRAGQPTIS